MRTPPAAWPGELARPTHWDTDRRTSREIRCSSPSVGATCIQSRVVTTGDSSGNISDRLQKAIAGLDHASLWQLAQIAGALAAPLDGTVNEDAGLITPPFRQEFEARLKVHHATHSRQLDRISLEDAFRAASRAAGRAVRGTTYATEPFIDEVVDGEGIALKSTAAKDVRANKVHISKLSEASWIQDVRGAQAREQAAKEQISKFLAETQRIYQLRVLPDIAAWRYQFVEVPTRLFEPILDLDRQLFAPDGPRIPVEDTVGPCLKLVLDRSDAKITITNIPITRCIIHASWNIPKKQGDAGTVQED